jgi:tetratricopeptide (TPR) repeat protein
VVVAEPEPVPDRGRGAPGATSRDRRTKPAIPPTPRTTPAIESAADTPRAASLPSVTRADYAERLNRGMRNRPPTGDDSAARAWTAVAAGVVLALVVGALWLWLKNRPATPDVAEAPETPTTITGAALDTADSLAFAQLVAQATAAPMDPRARGVSDALLVRGRTADAYQLLQRIVAADSTTPCRACAAVPALAGAAQSLDSFAISEQALRRWMQRDPAQPEPARRLAEQVLREGRLAEAALLVDSAQARGAGALWARQQRMERAMAGGFWPVARDLVVDSFAPGMSGARARWWRVTFERLRGRPASAAAYARALLGLGVPASQEQGDAISPSEMRAVATLALLDAGDVAGARALLAEPLARRDSGPLLVEEAVLRARLHAAAGDTAALAALADSIVRTSLAGPHARSVALRHYLRGIAAAARGVHDDAVTHFEAALRVDRVHAPAINVALARSLLALGRPADAIPVLRSATRARVLPGGVGDEPFPVVREQLALAHAAIGARDSARVHARVALDAWNESEAVIRVRGNALRRAVGLVRRPRADGAAGETP